MKTFMPKVSVIIPTYNRSDMVKEAISSVLVQTEPDFEIIVVDDGSTDGTRQVIESIPDSRIRYLYKDNGGVASALNYGIARAKGSFIAILASDDLWRENFLKAMLDNLQAQRMYGLAYSSVGLIRHNGRIEAWCKPGDCKSGWVTSYLFKRGFVCADATVFRKELLQGLAFDESLLSAEDSDFLLRLSIRTPFIYVPKILLHVRKSPDSLCKILGANCNRILSLERFYFRLGGKEGISYRVAMLKLSHAYRQAAKRFLRAQKIKAASFLYKRAISYWPYDYRLYLDFLTTLLHKGGRDREPNWKMPEPLGDPVGSTHLISSSAEDDEGKNKSGVSSVVS